MGKYDLGCCYVMLECIRFPDGVAYGNDVSKSLSKGKNSEKISFQSCSVLCPLHFGAPNMANRLFRLISRAFCPSCVPK